MAKMHLIAASLFVIVPVLHAQEDAEEAPGADNAAIAAQLDETRAAIFKLFNDEKFAEIAEQYCHEDITCVWNDGSVSKGRQAIPEFFAKLKTFIDVMQVAPTTEDRFVYEDGKYVVSIGGLGDTYTMADGKEFDLGSVWMSTLAFEDGEWKLISFAVSTNAFDNQVIDAFLFLRTLVAGGVGIVIGLVLSLTVSTVLRLRKSG